MFRVSPSTWGILSSACPQISNRSQNPWTHQVVMIELSILSLILQARSNNEFHVEGLTIYLLGMFEEFSLLSLLCFPLPLTVWSSSGSQFGVGVLIFLSVNFIFPGDYTPWTSPRLIAELYLSIWGFATTLKALNLVIYWRCPGTSSATAHLQTCPLPTTLAAPPQCPTKWSPKAFLD